MIEDVGPAIESVIAEEGLVTSDVEPGARRVESALEHVEPAVEDVEPTIQDVEHSFEHIKHTTEDVKLAIRDVEPTFESIEPTVDEVVPIIEDFQPAIPVLAATSEHTEAIVEGADLTVETVEPTIGAAEVDFTHGETGIEHVELAYKPIEPTFGNVEPTVDHIGVAIEQFTTSTIGNTWGTDAEMGHFITYDDMLDTSASENTTIGNPRLLQDHAETSYDSPDTQATPTEQWIPSQASNHPTKPNDLPRLEVSLEQNIADVPNNLQNSQEPPSDDDEGKCHILNIFFA